MNSKEKPILDRIKHLEDAISKSREYLKTGAHAHWHGFQPLFFNKARDGEVLPPNKDWIRKAFLPSREKALKKAQDTLEKLTKQ